MKKLLFLLIVLSIVGSLFLGCSNSGMFLAVNNTNVELSEANYEIVARGVKGEAEAGYIFGFSYSVGAVANSVAVARVTGTGMLYKEALENFWENFERDYGSIEGRKVAMVNVHYDSELLNLFFYTGVKIFVRADIVEFQE